MVIALGLGAALLIGVGDVFGSLAGRKGRVLATTLWVFLTSAIPLAILAIAIGGTASVGDYLFGGVAGVGGGLGLFSLYIGYSTATIGVVGPTAAVVGAALPVAVGIGIGDDAGSLALVGIGIGIVAVGLIGWRPDLGPSGDRKSALGYGLAAGLSFGVMATFLGLTGEESGILPLIPTRAVSALLLVVIAATRSVPMMPMRESWRYIPGTTVAAVGGLAMFIVAAQENLTIAGLLLQMAYAVTAALAVIVFGERPTPTQRLGFAAAITAIVLIAVG